MRSSLLSTILAVAAAQTVTEVGETPFKAEWPDANVAVYSEGIVGETLTTLDDGRKTVEFVTVWKTVCDGCLFANGAVIMGYLQVESVNEAGKYDGFSCSTVFNKDAAYNSDPAVRNYKAVDALTANGNMWDDYGHIMDMNPWRKSDEDVETLYATGYTNEKKQPQMSSQMCTCWVPVYETAADGVSVPETNTYGENITAIGWPYWNIKNAGAFPLTLGFKVFQTPSDTEPYLFADTTFDWQSFDHGFTAPPADETPGTDDGAMADGAAALLSAAATALAAFLVF